MSVTAAHAAGPFLVGRDVVTIRTNHAGLAADLQVTLGDLRHVGTHPGSAVAFTAIRRDEPGETHPWAVLRDGEPCEPTLSDDYVRPYLLWELTRLLLERCPPLTPVHAAAVSLRGRAIVLAGVSHAGKSTLSAWLTAHGWGFLTDEVALLDVRRDATVWVQPFWRPIGVRRPGPIDSLYTVGSETDEALVPASQLGRLAGPSRLAAIVFPDRGTLPRSLVPAEPAAAVRQLAAHLPRLALDRRSGFRDIVQVVRAVPAFHLGVDSLDAAEATLRTLVGGA